MPNILAAVDNVIQIHDAWADDPKSGPVIPLELEEAFTALFDEARLSDVPNTQRTLFRCIEVMEERWRDYASGLCDDKQAPLPVFWKALRALIHERTATEELKPKRPESVKQLRRENVADFQIANGIYGHRGVGPFLKDGRIQHELIDKEENEPGSVVPLDWIHPAEIERLERHNVDVQQRLKKIDEKANAARRPVETVEGMLRDGANIEQICAVCGVTAEQVKGVAEVLKIEPKFRENFGATRGPHEPEINEAAAQAVGVDTRQSLRQDKKTPVKRDHKEHVIELHEGNPEMGAAEIAAEIGNKLNAREVARIIQEHDKQAVKA